MRDSQITSLTRLLIIIDGPEFHHGDCKGADVQAATIAYKLGYYIECHPPINPKHRGWFEHNDLINPEYGYIIRDQHIVNDTRILIACPHTPYEIVRSETWTTVRYARTLKRPIYIIKPDGTVEHENVQFPLI
jgi:hypothetical protein